MATSDTPAPTSDGVWIYADSNVPFHYRCLICGFETGVFGAALDHQRGPRNCASDLVFDGRFRNYYDDESPGRPGPTAHPSPRDGRDSRVRRSTAAVLGDATRVWWGSVSGELRRVWRTQLLRKVAVLGRVGLPFRSVVRYSELDGGRAGFRRGPTMGRR